MDNIQSTINEKEKERETITENITQYRTQLSSDQTSLNLAKSQLRS